MSALVKDMAFGMFFRSLVGAKEAFRDRIAASVE
jgi:hypothetical protein